MEETIIKNKMEFGFVDYNMISIIRWKDNEI
jgi:hypothetical protein